MKWSKLGQVFVPDGTRPWMLTHAANPVAEHVAGDVFRVYFGARDVGNRTSIAWAEVEIGEQPRVLGLCPEPVIGPGETGLFDDSGASMGCLVQADGRRLLYYVGWNLGVTVPWRNGIGLAVDEGPGGAFRKWSAAPVMDRAGCDPYSLSYPWVIRDGGRFRMWYGSNLTWGCGQKDMGHVIKHAESDDGLHWRRTGDTVLGLLPPDEYALCRPCVMRDGPLYRMWYCHRGGAYRIGYAESADGLTWERRPDLVGIGVSATGWDSEMIAYPHVFDHGGRRWMLYNGNGYGRTGMGLAVLE